MNKLYVSVLSLGLVGCASNKEMVNYHMQIGEQPAVLSVDEDQRRCYLRKNMSEEERTRQDGKQIDGRHLLITYKCGEPEKIEASAMAFGDKTLGMIDEPQTFFGLGYLRSVAKKAEREFQGSKSRPVRRNFQQGLSNLLQ